MPIPLVAERGVPHGGLMPVPVNIETETIPMTATASTATAMSNAPGG